MTGSGGERQRCSCTLFVFRMFIWVTTGDSDTDKAFRPSGQFSRSKTETKAADLMDLNSPNTWNAAPKLLGGGFWMSPSGQVVDSSCFWRKPPGLCAHRVPGTIGFLQKSVPAGRRYWSEQPLRGRDRGKERDTHRAVQFKTHKEGLRHFGWSWELHQNKQPQPSGFWWQIQPAMVGHPWTAHFNSASWIIQKSVASTLW